MSSTTAKRPSEQPTVFVQPTEASVTITKLPKDLHSTEVLTSDLAAFVTATSSTANSVIDSAAEELNRRIAKQFEEFEKEPAKAGSLSITLE
jgi:hypothetical protein